MKTLLAGLFVLGALLAGSTASSVGAASAGFRPAGVVPHFGSKPTLRAARVTTTKAAGLPTCGSITCAAYATGVNGFLQDVAAASGTATNVYSTDTQYSDTTGNIAYTETFGGTYVDTNSFPTDGCPTSAAATCLSEAQLIGEITRDLGANGWTEGGTHLFVILLPDAVDTCFDSDPSHGCASNAFCAYHDNFSSLIFAVEPFNLGWGCDGTAVGQGLPNGPEIDESVNTLSHEANEAITDPTPENASSGWWSDTTNDEIGDLCAWSFGDPLGTTLGGQPYNQVINGHDYSLQLEYSNAANSNNGGCVQHLGGTASPISDGGSGPLTYHNGPVMRTATVYTIYWLPALPVSSIAPIVSGTTAVGKQLSTTPGTWTNSPTGYAYSWQRCDTTGSNCVPIANATSPAYTLVSADAGHTIRSEVEASNSAGTAAAGYTPSLPTAVVVDKPTVLTKPAISGAAKVGTRLSASKGTWTNSPTHYAYHWLRCSSSGTSCKSITRATRSSYKVAPADAGHRLEVRVTATNGAGHTDAISAPTRKVRT